MWGFATLSLTSDRYQEITQITGMDVAIPHGFVTHQTLGEALHAILERDGAERALTILEQLLQRGFAVAKASGASIRWSMWTVGSLSDSPHRGGLTIHNITALP